jgi:hypothetical protein
LAHEAPPLRFQRLCPFLALPTRLGQRRGHEAGIMADDELLDLGSRDRLRRAVV